jgi:hypothetical protein
MGDEPWSHIALERNKTGRRKVLSSIRHRNVLNKPIVAASRTVQKPLIWL